MRFRERTLASASGMYAVAALLGASAFTADGRSGQDSSRGSTPSAAPSSRVLEVSSPEADQSNEDSITVDVDLARWLEATSPDGSLVIERFSLPGDVQVSLELDRFEVTRADTRYVLGRLGGTDVELAYRPSNLAMYRGHVRGLSNSHVFIGFGGGNAFGFIELGGGIQRYQISAVPDAQGPIGPTSLSVFRSDSVVSLPPNVALCGVDTSRLVAEPIPVTAQSGTLPPTPRVIELAIETDYELYELFNDVDAVADYVTLLYAAVSDIYMRDVNARFELTFVRVWDTPDDLFNEENPLSAFQQYWNQNMGEVQRDAAQFFSGRRNMPFGGIAYLGSLCGNSAYSVVGYALGYFPNPDAPSAFHYDIHVTAHELGHNCDAFHSHDYGIDTCNDLFGTAVRGTIMSYCSQTRSGGNSNTDLRLHAIIQDVMSDYFNQIDCLFHDCNGNGVDDQQEIRDGDSDDANGNGVPDECEDCNNNGQLDTIDITNGTSNDLNGNAIPDECEADCNSNDIPDDLDIAPGGGSLDLNGNSIPDECEADCDGSGESDYNQIQADMTLDVDRNAVLDSCQDCDDDGVNDLDTLGGAHNVWVANRDPGGAAKEFHAVSGALVKTSEQNVINDGNDLIISADGRIFVSSSGNNRVVELNAAGDYVGNFVQPGSGGLAYPGALTFGPDGDLFVVSRDTHSVLRYDGLTGDFLDVFVSSESGGLSYPFGLAFGPDGNLYVASYDTDDSVLRYDGSTGQFIDIFVPVAGNGGLNFSRGLLFKPDGNLLVASRLTNQVLEYDGETGAFVRQFNNGGTEEALTLDGPWGLRLGPTGNVFVSRNIILQGESHEGGTSADTQHLHINSTRIFEFDVDSGIFLRSFVIGHDTELWTPTGFDFMPDLGLDCNFNMIPDSCDIASGVSDDNNGNGIPDECETAGDIDGDGSVGLSDLLILLASWGPCADCGQCPADLNGDCTVGVADLLILLANWG